MLKTALKRTDKFRLLAVVLPLLCVLCLACEQQESIAQDTPAKAKPEQQKPSPGEDSHEGHNHGGESEAATPAEPAAQGGGHAHEHEDDHIVRKNQPGECENSRAEVTLKSEAVTNAGIKIGDSVVKPRTATVELTGRVQLNEDMTAHITPRAQGTVSEVLVSLGDEVEEGQVLALLNSTEVREAKAVYLSSKASFDLLEQNLDREKKLFERKVLVELNSARTQYLTTKATTELLSKNYDREKALYDKKIASEKELVEAETEHKKALIELENARTQLNLLGLEPTEVEKKNWVPSPEKIKATALSKVITEAQKELYEAEKEFEKARIDLQFAESKLHLLGLDEEEVKAVKTHGDVLAELPIRAPFQGIIVDKHASLGENVGTDSDVFKLSDMLTLWVMADVYEKDIHKIEKGMEVLITASGLPGQPFEGNIAYIHHIFDECASKCKARIETINVEDKLKPGMFVNISVKLNTSADETALYVPKSAVQNDGTCCDLIFIVTGENVFESRKVTLGSESGDEIEILSGLESHDKIVVEGGFALKSEVLKSKLGSG